MRTVVRYLGGAVPIVAPRVLTIGGGLAGDRTTEGAGAGSTVL